jgi:hypothetical protein
MVPDADADDPVASLRRYCEFGEDRVYLLVALARPKENPPLSSGSAVALREVVGERADIRRAYDRLRGAAEAYRTDAGEPLRFRLYLTVNARNALDGYFAFRERTDGWVRDRLAGDAAATPKFRRVDDHWKSELQRPAAREETRLLFDLDGAGERDRRDLLAALEARTTVVTCRETPNGYHVVAEKFDYTGLHADVDYELNTDGLLFVTRLAGANEA